MFRAKDTFWAPDNRRIVKGDLVAPDDPVVDGREDLFEAVVIPQAIQPKKKTDAEAKSGDDQPPSDNADQNPADDADAKSGDDQAASNADSSTPAPARTPAAPKAPARTTARKTAAPKGGATS